MKLFEKCKRLSEAYGTVKSYKHKSVFYRFWTLIILGFAVVFISVMLLVSNYNNTKYYNNISGMFSKNMYNMRNSLDSVFAEIISETKKISENEDVINAKDKEIFDEAKTPEIEKFLRRVHSESDFIKSVYLYYPNSGYIVSSSVLYPSGPRVQFPDSMWYDAYYSGESEIFLREYPENAIFQKCISVCKKINGDDNIIAVYNINYDKFNIIRKKNVLMDYEISMINEAGTIIYSTDNEKTGRDVNSYKEMSNIYFMSVNNYTVNSYMTWSVLYESVQTKNLKLSIVAEIPKKNIDDMNGNKNTNIIIALILAVVLLALSVFISTKFYGFVMMFFDQIPPEKNTNAGENTDELTDISNQISNIINKKSETESELAESLMQLQKAQSIALQSQFSPHFLFNTLQMINSIALAELDGDSDITAAVSLLCNILHVAIDTTEYTCKLREELTLAKDYITLQNMKYEGVFDVSFDIDDETLDITVAKLFLQPILENSMHHGYDVRRKNMRINISAHLVKGKLVVTVEDDGIGMTPERQREIAENLNNKQLEKKDSIGLLNLNQRVKLIFGYEYGCRIENNGHGVTVTVIFPGR